MPVEQDMPSNAEWRVWGKQDPLWGVSSWPGRQRDGDNPWTDAEFYQLGDDWLDFNSAWLGCGRPNSKSVLEIGCGAGRITARLATTFSEVVATDVSEDMIAYARARVTSPAIDWRLSNGATLPAPDNSVDAVFSCHVFQHFPDNSAQLRIFAEIHRVLKSDGTFFIHLPMHFFPTPNARFSQLARGAYGTYVRLAKMRALLQAQLMRFGAKPGMRGTSYEMPLLMADLRRLGFDSIAVSMVSVRTNDSLHPCIYGHKP